MFFILSKILFYLVMPLVWVVGLLIYSFITSKKQRKKASRIIALVLLIFFSNGLIAEACFNSWEEEAIALKKLEHHDIAVVLTGVVQTSLKPRDRVYFSKGADRITHGYQLYKMKKVDKILITGASGRLVGEKLVEAEFLRDFLLMLNVPERDIILETASRNTHENAVFTSQILQKDYPGASVVLVTSAFHMKRASGCFDKAEIAHTPFPTDFRGGEIRLTFSNIVVPSESALAKWALLIHEMLGYFVYKVLGYA